jgi:hypothetical protein
MVLKDAAAARKKSRTGWDKAFLRPVTDPIWWSTTVVALVAAFGILYGVYANNPAWGSGGLSDVAALVGAAFAAVGGHAMLTSLRE